jgi:hypothetical protein
MHIRRKLTALIILFILSLQVAQLAPAAVIRARSLSESAAITAVTVSAITINSWRYGGTTGKLRVYASDTFTQTGTFVIGSQRGSGQWYQQVDCTVAGTVLSIPSFSLQVTTTSSNSAANYTFVFVDATGRERDIWMGEILVPDTFGANVTWDQLYLYSTQRTTRRADYEVYNKDQVNALLAGTVANPDASTTVKGIGTSSVAPALSTNPIFVETGDPRNSNTRTPTDASVTTAKIAGGGLAPSTIAGTALVATDVGTAANKIVRLDSSARLPAVDGSLLTNILSSAQSVFNPVTYGAVLNVKCVDGVTTSASATFTSACATFTSADNGKFIRIERAGGSNVDLQATITYVSAHTITLSVTAGSTLAATPFSYGVDNTTAFQATETALEAAGMGRIFQVPDGDCFVSGSGADILKFQKQVTIQGSGWSSRIIVLSGTGASTDIIHLAPNAGLLGAPNYNGFSGFPGMGITLRDFAIVQSAGTPGRNGIFIDSNSVANGYILKLKIDHVYIGRLGGQAVVSGTAGTTDGAPVASVIQDCMFQRGINLQNAGDTIAILRNRISGPDQGIRIKQIAGATTLVVSDNNIISAGGMWIEGQEFHPIITRNILELALDAGVSLQNEADPAGHNSAVMDIDCSVGTGCTDAFISENVVSSLSGTALDGIRINACASCNVQNNSINVQGGAHPLNITVNAQGTVLSRNHYIGAGTTITNTPPDTLDLVAAWKNNNFGAGLTVGNNIPLNGGLQLGVGAGAPAKPACGSTTRGLFWVTYSGAGVKDVVEVCAKDAGDSYAYRAIY